MSENRTYSVIVVGAGAAGVGVGIVLRDAGIEDFVLLERDQIGGSFAKWPREMRFITPSFTSNAFGFLDLNAIALGTSPAFSLSTEHPTGEAYAEYLKAVAAHFELPIHTGIHVHQVDALPDEQGFHLTTSEGVYTGRFVIWAAGEFGYPRRAAFKGDDLCLHNSHVETWKDVGGNDIVIIGGGESGIDAAVNLVRFGKTVTVLDPHAPWDSDSPDPSRSLAPYTLERLEDALETGRLFLYGDVTVSEVCRYGAGYEVCTPHDEAYDSDSPPILATGFTGSLRLIGDHFEWDEDGYAVLSPVDESTVTPGLFVVGPSVRHDNVIFCFVYKYRQRFAVVVKAILQHLEMDLDPLEVYRQQNMFLEDWTCCKDECAC